MNSDVIKPTQEESKLENIISMQGQIYTYGKYAGKHTFSEEEFKLLYRSKYFSEKHTQYYFRRKLKEALFNNFKYLGFDIVETTPDKLFKEYIITNGFYKSVEDINELVSSTSYYNYIFGIENCSLDLAEQVSLTDKTSHLYHLKGRAAKRIGYFDSVNISTIPLLKDKSYKMRLEIYKQLNIKKYADEMLKDPAYGVKISAYKRLGIIENLDTMLDDSDYKIRLAAAERAPMHYPKFQNMLNEKSWKVVQHVASKVEKKYLPYIAVNKKAENYYTKKIISERLDWPDM